MLSFSNVSFTYGRRGKEVLSGLSLDFEENGIYGILGKNGTGKSTMLYLAAGTKYLLMDEPTNGLDIPSKKVFREVIAREMTEERVMIISTHQVRDVEQLIDHVVIVNDGTVQLNASTAEIESRLRFEQRAVGADLSDAIFVQQTMRGIELICPNSGNDETPIDLELLFNALQTVPAEKLMGRNGNN